MNADIDGSADIDSTKIDLSSSGYLATGTPSATITGDWTFEGQTNIDNLVASLASIGTADINGGTLDGVNIGTTTATGELFVNNSSDVADGLGDQGTSGEVLTSAGSGANPTWASPSGGWTNEQKFTSSGTWTKPSTTSKVFVKLLSGGGGGAFNSQYGAGNGTAGGTSSFVGSTTVSATGGGGASTSQAGAGGVGTGTLYASGKAGGDGEDATSGEGGDSGLGFGRGGAETTSSTGNNGFVYGGGGSGAAQTNGCFGGGGGAYADGLVTVTGNVTVTTGVGGAGHGTAGDGAAGVVIVYWNE